MAYGPLELSGVRDQDIPELLAVAQRGVHAPDRMPFSFPWTDAHADELPLNFAQFHWGNRARFTRDSWSLELAVRHEGIVVGSQGVTTTGFLVARTGETGSWLGMSHQGQGIGTLMRQAVCALLFDHLDFTQITSAAFTDNPSSLTVSRKVGYRPNGLTRVARRGQPAVMQHLLLRPTDFVRGPHELDVEGIAPVRRLIGLDA